MQGVHTQELGYAREFQGVLGALNPECNSTGERRTPVPLGRGSSFGKFYSNVIDPVQPSYGSIRLHVADFTLSPP
jgi:hypothetical protein